MNKRGQIAIFVVIGLVLIIALVFIFLFRDNLIDFNKKNTNPQKYLEGQASDINKMINKCLKKEITDATKKLLENAGQFDEPVNYIAYKGRKYRILCQKLKDTDKCLSSPIFLKEINKKLIEYTKNKIENCIKIENFENQGYDITKLSEPILNIEIKNKEIFVDYDYSIKLVRDENSVIIKSNSVRLDIPLGEIITETNLVLDQRAKLGRTDPLGLGLLSLNKYSIILHKPYPNEIYDVGLTDNPTYHLYFGVQGNGRFA